MRFPAKKTTRLPRSTERFPAKKRWHSSPPVGLSCDSSPPPPESVRADGRTYADVTTKISRIDRLPGGSDELASSAGSRCLAIVTSRREKRASFPSLQKWRWQTDVRVRATNVFFVLLSFQLSLFYWVMEC